tara:strand:+ start:4326 stop:5018 length:693 start_codon:yes stop_codon:yes gene_type:complete
MLVYMKLKNKTHKMIIQKGGQDITQSLPSVESVSNNKELPVPIKRLPYDIKIFSFLCIMGIVVKIIFGQTSNDYAKATVWGYGFSILALFGLLVSSFGIFNKDHASSGVIGFLKKIFKNALPIILSIVIIALIIVQNVSFYKQINSGRVADEYYQFSGVSSFLILVQTVLVINYLMDILSGQRNKDDVEKNGVMTALASEMNSIILILSVMNVGIIGVLQVVLKYFSTDG